MRNTTDLEMMLLKAKLQVVVAEWVTSLICSEVVVVDNNKPVLKRESQCNTHSKSHLKKSIMENKQKLP